MSIRLRPAYLGEPLRYTKGRNLSGMPSWPVLPHQLEFIARDGSEIVYTAIAQRLQAVHIAGRNRCSLRQLGSTIVRPAHLERLVELDVLRKHYYASGAWQYTFTPYTRPWFMAVLTKDHP